MAWRHFADTCSLTLQMVWMFDMFRWDNNGQDFKFLHVFTKIESFEKWTECRFTLAEDKDGVYNSDAPALAAEEGCPNGNKRAKTARDAAPSAKRLESSIE
ncbi:putative methionyl-tRNA synthetase [Hordeum vulgare]|nr:putative methionyl-tRNA synthetase [Hordeum vulgare]